MLSHIGTNRDQWSHLGTNNYPLTWSIFVLLLPRSSLWVQCDAREIDAHRKPWRDGSHHRILVRETVCPPMVNARKPTAGSVKAAAKSSTSTQTFSPEWPTHEWERSPPKPSASPPLGSATNNRTPPKKRRLDDFNLPPFPRSHLIAGVHYFVRSEVEIFKRQLLNQPPEPVVSGPICFVTIGQLAVELSTSRATVKRRMRAAAAAAAAAPVAKRAPAKRRLEPVGG